MIRRPMDCDWRFFLGNTNMWGGAPHPDDSWRTVSLPHDWSIEHPPSEANPCGPSGGFLPGGTGWYSKEFEAPENWRGQTVLVEFEGVYENAEVWLNGNFLFRHPYGYTSFMVDLTAHIALGAANRLSVRVDNSSHPNCRWYSGSGIYRHVWLLVGDPTHIEPWGVRVTTPYASDGAATVAIETLIKCADSCEAVEVRSTVVHPDGGIVAEAVTPVEQGRGEGACRQIINLGANPGDRPPALWSPETPQLYELHSELLAHGICLDEATTAFGIRSISFDVERGFSLNGSSLKLKGGCVHHDNGPLGAASYDRAEERKVGLLKASGYNAVRCAHNPPAPAFLDACDRLGLLVIDEAFDCWRVGKLPYDYHVTFADWWKRDLEAMVRRDANHPSIIMWSIGNEIAERDGNSDGARVASELARLTRDLDPTRPVTAAICEVSGDWERTAPVFSALDVCGYNYQEGHYRSDHELHPERVMYGAEAMPWFAHKHWETVQQLPYVLGDFVWTALDYLGEAGLGMVRYKDEEMKWSGGWPWVQAFCGDIDICGWKRPQSHYRDMVWGVGTGIWLGVRTPVPEGKVGNYEWWSWPEVIPAWTWPGAEGQPLAVEVYSDCDTVELVLNGRPIGRRPAGRANAYLATFEVPYEPGELKAIGYTDAAPSESSTLTATLRTAGPPVAVRLTPDRAMLAPIVGDLCYVTVEIVDAAGEVCIGAEPEVHFDVSGAALLAAVASNNPRSTESYQGTPEAPISSRRAYRGKCLAVLKTSGGPGVALLVAEAEGLQTGDLRIEVGA